MAAATLPQSTTAGTSPARLLQFDGAPCAVLGLVTGIAAGPVAERLGTDRTGVVRADRIGLAVYAVGLLVSSGTRRARPALRAAAIGNVGREVASRAIAIRGT